MSSTIFLANDKYYAELTQAYNVGDSTIYLTAPPDNVPTLLVLARGTANETVFQVLNKTVNSVTNVTRLKGANVELIEQTPVTCLNNAEFINQYRSYLGLDLKGTWDSGTAYLKYDAVSYGGSTYIALQDGTNHLPTDTDYWQVMSAKGDQGIQGVKGDKGDAGGVDPTTLKDATLIEDTTNTNSYAGSCSPAIVSYAIGQKFNLKVTNANTGNVTVNICSLGAKAVKKNVSEDLAVGELKAGQIIPIVYDGTNFQLVGGGGSGGGDFLVTQIFS